MPFFMLKGGDGEARATAFIARLSWRSLTECVVKTKDNVS